MPVQPKLIITQIKTLKVIIFLTCSFLQNASAKGSFQKMEQDFFHAMDVIEASKNFDQRQEAFQKLFDLSQKHQFVYAQDTLAGMYLNGDGVPKSPKVARVLYELSAKKGYGPSQFNCGIMYKNGQGGEKDLKKALHYLTHAAKNKRDLGDLTLDADYYRDEVERSLK